MNQHEKYELLANFFKLFQDKRWLLAKFLIDNNAINDSFLKKINIEENEPVTDFENIEKLNSYFNKLISKESENHKMDLEVKLLQLIEEERYEEAAKLRDWLKKTKKK